MEINSIIKYLFSEENTQEDIQEYKTDDYVFTRNKVTNTLTIEGLKSFNLRVKILEIYLGNINTTHLNKVVNAIIE